MKFVVEGETLEDLKKVLDHLKEEELVDYVELLKDNHRDRSEHLEFAFLNSNDAVLDEYALSADTAPNHIYSSVARIRHAMRSQGLQ